jgi:hypothetical protein
LSKPLSSLKSLKDCEGRKLEGLEAEYCGVSVECLRSIQYGDQWGQRIKGFYDDYHARNEGRTLRKRTRKKAVKIRGNKYVKFR